MNLFTPNAELPFSERRFIAYRIIEIILFIGTAITLLALAGKQGLWIDELNFTWGAVIHGNFMDVTKKTAEITSSMYLYMWLMMPLSRVMPYGEFWLRLPSIIFFLLSVLAIRKLAVETAGRDLGFFAFVLAITTRNMWTDMAWEARPYSLWVLLTALTTLVYLRRIKQETPARIVIYGVLMALQFYTQMFSILTIAFFGLADLVLCVMKKVRFRCIISYILALVLSIPSLVFTAKYTTIDIGEFWPPLPGNLITAIGKVAYFFLGNPGTGLLFLLSAIGILAHYVVTFKNRDRDTFNVLSFFTLSGAWVLGITYVYSQLVNPEGSLWAYRYFSGVWPQVYIITAFGGIMTVKWFLTHIKLSKGAAIIGMSLFLGLGATYSISSAINNQLSPDTPFLEVAEIIAADEKAYADTSILIIAHDYEPWSEYYFSLRGFEVPRNIKIPEGTPRLLVVGVTSEEFIDIDGVLAYDRVYVCEIHNKIDRDMFETINENYDVVDKFAFKGAGLIDRFETTKLWVFSRKMGL